MSANLQHPSDRIILVAIPDEWRIQVHRILEENGYSVVIATSEDEARVVLQESYLDGAVIVSDWAIGQESAKTGLLQLAKGKIPTICLVRKSIQSTQGRWFEEVYHPPLHEYCTILFAADELLVRLNAAISKAETGT